MPALPDREELIRVLCGTLSHESITCLVGLLHRLSIDAHPQVSNIAAIRDLYRSATLAVIALLTAWEGQQGPILSRFYGFIIGQIIEGFHRAAQQIGDPDKREDMERARESLQLIKSDLDAGKLGVTTLVN